MNSGCLYVDVSGAKFNRGEWEVETKVEAVGTMLTGQYGGIYEKPLGMNVRSEAPQDCECSLSGSDSKSMKGPRKLIWDGTFGDLR